MFAKRIRLVRFVLIFGATAMTTVACQKSPFGPTTPNSIEGEWGGVFVVQSCTESGSAIGASLCQGFPVGRIPTAGSQTVSLGLTPCAPSGTCSVPAPAGIPDAARLNGLLNLFQFTAGNVNGQPIIGGISLSVDGSFDNDRVLVLLTPRFEGIPDTIPSRNMAKLDSWRSTVSGLNMSGSFAFTVLVDDHPVSASPRGPGSVSVGATLRDVKKCRDAQVRSFICP